MVYILLASLVGLLFGRLLRTLHLDSWLQIADRLFAPLLSLMIISLTFGVFRNQEATAQFAEVGKQVVLLAVSGMLGSILLAPLAQRLLGRRTKFALSLSSRRLGAERRALPLTEVSLSVRLRSCTQKIAAMQTALLLFLSFLLGYLLAQNFPTAVNAETMELLRVDALFGLMLLVGISIGSDRRTFTVLRSSGAWIFTVPLLTIIGSLMGTAVVSLLLHNVSTLEAMSVGAGLGFYSVSSAIISNIAGPALGLLALLVNLSRELLTMVLAPQMTRVFGPLGPITSGGATSMNSTLPMISLCSGKEYTTVAFINGLILSLLVPFLVTALLYFQG